MKFQYFITARYRNKANALELARILRKKGKSVYCFVESKASLKNAGSLEDDPKMVMKKFESIQNWRQDKGVREIFSSDMRALKNSHTIIVLLPIGKSGHIEAGVAYGLGKNLILIGDQKKTESLYLIFNEVYKDISEFVEIGL